MAKHNLWMSVSDLMTGLMVIFLFIAIAYSQQLQQKAEELEKAQEQLRSSVAVLTQYNAHRDGLHEKLIREFAQDTAHWHMHIGEDLSIRFTNVDVLFESREDALKPGFQSILDEFLPRYFNTLLSDSLRTHISEIRIEGHTDPTSTDQSDPYMTNLKLSQRRANSVLSYYRHSVHFRQLRQEDKQQLEFWFTANGLSFGHTLNSQGELTQTSKNKIVDNDRSRRVEIRIITNSEKLVSDFGKQIDNGIHF